MDLNDLKPKSETITITLRHPVTGEVLKNDNTDTDMTIQLVSPHTRKYKAMLFKLSQGRLKDSKDAKDEPDFDTMYDFSVDFLVDMTTGWDITFEGTQPKFSPKIANKLYNDIVWIKEQVEFELNTYDVFTKD
jgi:hypothetical protein